MISGDRPLTSPDETGDVLIGTSADPAIVERHRAAGRNVILADVTDDDFWARTTANNIKVRLLAMSQYEENLCVARRIQQLEGESAHLFAVADYPEQVEAFKAVGVDTSWNMDTEAGKGFAEEVIRHLGDDL